MAEHGPATQPRDLTALFIGLLCGAFRSMGPGASLSVRRNSNIHVRISFKNFTVCEFNELYYYHYVHIRTEEFKHPCPYRGIQTSMVSVQRNSNIHGVRTEDKKTFYLFNFFFFRINYVT